MNSVFLGLYGKLACNRLFGRKKFFLRVHMEQKLIYKNSWIFFIVKSCSFQFPFSGTPATFFIY